MQTYWSGWRAALLTTLGLGSVLACGEAVSGLEDGSGGDSGSGGLSPGSAGKGSGGGATAGSPTFAGHSGRAGAGGAVTVGGTGSAGRIGSAGRGGAGATGGTAGAGRAGAGGRHAGGSDVGGVGGSDVGGSDVGGAPIGGGGSGSGGGLGELFECHNPRPYPSAFGAQVEAEHAAAPAPPRDPIVVLPTYIQCEDGWLHRPTADMECGSNVPRADFTVSQQGGACTRDSDCTEKALGYCSQGGNALPHCRYGCTRDDQCESGQICVCGDPVGQCAPAECRSNAECASGLCVGTPIGAPGAGCGPVTFKFSCAKAEDRCASAADCSDGGDACDDRAGSRQCFPAPVCGRPFLVNGHARTALSCPDAAGWSAPSAPERGALDVQSRLALAAHWTHLGLMEHASVAAFARFILELLALGAPADLVRDAQRALGDEIAHTELCFGLATAYGATEVGAGPLPIQGALDARTPTEIVTTAFLEACIGETIAAVEARLALEHTRDPEVARVLEQITADEARHAELGWRFVQWALQAFDSGARDNLAQTLTALAQQEATYRPEVTDDGNAHLLAHGMLTPALRAEARRIAFAELITPWTAALMSSVVRAA